MFWFRSRFRRVSTCYSHPQRSHFPRAYPSSSCLCYYHIHRDCTSGTDRLQEGSRFDLEVQKSWCDYGSCSHGYTDTHMLRRAKDQGRFRGLLRPMRRVGYRQVIFVQIRMMMRHRQHSTYRHRKKDLLMTRSCDIVSSQTTHLMS